MAAPLRILAWPEGFKDLVALRALAAKREKRDHLERAGAQAPARPFAAVDRERAEERDQRTVVEF